MSDQTPRDPQQPEPREPIGAHDPAPQHPAPAASEQPTMQQPVATTDEPSRRRGLLRPILIGTGAAVAVLAVAGAGLGIADALDDRDDAQPATTTSQTGGSDGRGGPASSEGTGDDRGGDDDGTAASGAPSAQTGSGEAGDLVAAIDAAIAAVDGAEGATAIEVERDGWSVDVRLTDGTEVDVRVPSSGEPVVRQDDDDTTSDRVLDTARIADVVDAAIAAAGGGTVQSIETEDDDSHAYEVQVDLGGDRDVDVELAEDLSVVSVDD